MIFRPELAKLIRQDRKSQTRRIATDKTCRYQAGKSYAVQPGRGKTAICRITLTDVRLEPLGDLTLKDAKREGFVTTAEFFDYWREIHGRVDLDLPVWVLSFLLGDQTDIPRFLAARPGAPHGDYVSNPHLALTDAGEALTDMELDRFTKAARVGDAKRRNDPIWQERDRVARSLERMQESASSNGPVRDSIRRLQRELRVLDRKLAA